MNRKALPAPEAPSDSGTEYIAPRTPTEEQLAAIWAEVLSVPRVGAEDHFFELGGHSLLATRVLSRLRSAFEVELPVRALFEAPTLSALALKLDEAQRSRRAPQTSRLRSIVREGDIPLAFAQQRLWFLDQLEPGSPAYNLPIANRLSGPLNTEALQRAFEELVRRHESLRTTFSARDGQPIQVIAPSLSVPLEVVDLQEVPAAERETRARDLARQEALRPFDLVNGPLLRATLLRLGADDHLLVFVMHHIVSDGWSMGVLVREVATLYVAYASGQQPSLPALPVQYADFALWQRSWLQGEVLDAQLHFWKQQLSGAPAHLELPTDKPRPPVQTFRGDNVRVALPKALSESIKALSMRLGATPFMTLLAGFQVLLHRYSRQDDISVGSPIAGRRDAELEGLIGFFVNTLVLRSRVSPQATIRELLLQVRDTTLAAYEHQDLPFEKLVEQLQPQRDLSRSPFFQVMFVLQNAPTEALRLRQDLTLKPVTLAGGTSKFDWTLALTDTPEGFAGGLEYNIDLFERDTVVRAMEHLRILLEAAVAHPEARLSELSLLSEAEQRKLLVEWNDTHADAPRDATIHELFEAQAARTPDALAVLFGQQSLTFRELDTRANQLAHALRGLSVGPDIPVALCVEPSLEMVIGLMGILKAGGTYVPLDPAHPADRLSFMMEDCRAPLLLTQAHLVDTLPAFSGQVLRLDTDWQSLAVHGDAPLRHRTTPDNLAYIIYTSGSTGRPKGVMVPHRGVPNLVQAQAQAFGIRPGSRVLQFASFSFDASVSEVAVTLLSGATLCLARRDALMPGPGLVALLREQAINVVTFPPSLLALLPSEGLDSLHTVVSAGEACSPELVSRWASPGRRFLNGYGPTETTVCATMATCVPNGQRPPIGRPLPNVQLYVLDEHQRPVPIGVPGELYIGGLGVSRGYLNRPELTAEKFIPDPFSGEAGARLYRTGDLVRYRADGNLEYLGRTDFQVKVRGFRIELGELESVLDKHPGIRQSIVIAREDRPGDKRLVAYLAPSSQQAPTTAELRAHLKQHLPEYMVPSAFVVLEQLPLSPNGKVDRRALPTPEATVSGSDYLAPRTPIEELLAGIWAEVLSVPRVGIRDNFFELGGHSLLATRVTSRVFQVLERRVSVLTLFQNPTIELLAEALRQQQDASDAPRALVKLQAGEPHLRPLFLVHAAGGGVMSYTDLVGHLGADRPVYGLHDPALDGAEPMPASVEAMARHYVAQVREVQPHGPYYLGGWSFGGVLAFEMAQQLQAAGEKVDLLTLFDTHAPGKKGEVDEVNLLSAFCHNLGLSWRDLPLDSERLLQLNGRERLAYVLEQARGVVGGGAVVDLDQAWRLYETFMRHIRAQQSYEPRPYAGSAVLFKASTQPEGVAPDGRLGWSAWITGALEVQEVPGAHHTMLNEPHAAPLAERLTHHLKTLDQREAA
ncbi:amino acid adenylation domain-containing protein [Archangium violaceum]|uniref:amino acid adenylation domain-containing protein n=1 Tax=Archangium violaceum TaxID=83451 RepID=UPI0037BF5E4F